jgi:hypothetical protein
VEIPLEIREKMELPDGAKKISSNLQYTMRSSDTGEHCLFDCFFFVLSYGHTEWDVHGTKKIVALFLCPQFFF